MMGLEGGLYVCDDPAYWRAVLNVYQDVVMAKASKKGKTIALDKWYQEELPIAVSGRKDKHLTKEELVRLMEWKLSRGKFRPRLQQLVATNSSEMVESCTRKAFQLLPDVAAAMTELCKLKAVGPATASAILTSGAPEAAAFMADEAVESLPGLVPVQYTLKHYLLYLDGIQSCVKKLNEGQIARRACTSDHFERLEQTFERLEQIVQLWKTGLPSQDSLSPSAVWSSTWQNVDQPSSPPQIIRECFQIQS